MISEFDQVDERYLFNYVADNLNEHAMNDSNWLTEDMLFSAFNRDEIIKNLITEGENNEQL